MISYNQLFTFVLCILCVSSVNAQHNNRPKEIVSGHRIVFNQPPQKIPSSSSVDAPLMGNGYTGIAISGAPEKQVYYVARNDFWRLKSSFNQSFPAVLGKIEINIPELANSTYSIEQDLYNAKTYSQFSNNYTKVNFVSYVSAAEDIMIIEVQNKGQKIIKGEVNLAFPEETELIDNPPFDLVFKDDRADGETEEGITWISRGFSDDVEIPTKAAIAVGVLDHLTNDFTIEPGGKIWIICAFSSNFKMNDCESAVVDKIKSITQNELSMIDKDHQRWWMDFWEMSWVDIPDKNIEKQYYLSNYTMASCSRDKDFPPSIFGTWITKERPAWNGDYHLNYNHMAPYYGLFSSNHIEQAAPHDAPILAMMERGMYYSKKVSGIDDGIILPVGIGPLGIETTRRNKLMEEHRANWIKEGNVEYGGLLYGQKSNSSYCVVNMASHFYYTYDLDDAKLVYPFVKSVANFWEEYLTFENGRYVIYNDAIHEGTVGTKNPILSLGLVPMVINAAIDMSTEIGIDAEKHKKWQHILDNMSGYTYQKKKGKKVFRYSEMGTDWWQNNTLGIQHIYPAGQIGLDSDPELLHVAHNTVDVMQRWLDNNGSNSFFPAAVRIGYNPEIILDQLDQYVDHTYPNGFQLGNPHGIENMSTVPNTVNEMFLQSHEGVLKLFPVWPKDKSAEFHQLRAHGAFLVSSKLNNGKISNVNIMSEQGRLCSVLNPWSEKQVRLNRARGKDEILVGKILEIYTSKEEILKLSPVIDN